MPRIIALVKERKNQVLFGIHFYNSGNLLPDELRWCIQENKKQKKKKYYTKNYKNYKKQTNKQTIQNIVI